MTTTIRISGKVAKILNARELIINRGVEDGVEMGMKFAVLDPRANDVVDPDSHEVLGSIYRPKVGVEVVRVEPRLTLARTFKTRKVNVGGTARSWAAFSNILGQPPRYEEQPESLRTDESTWEDLDERDSYVKTGDPVEQILESDDPESPGPFIGIGAEERVPEEE